MFNFFVENWSKLRAFTSLQFKNPSVQEKRQFVLHQK
jgi:hypothetical protein